MPTESLICNSCGAPLDVPTSANFVSCNHCGTQLSINRSKGVTFTEQLARIEETTEALTDQLRELNSHQRLEALERDWQSRRMGFMLTGKKGRSYAPSKKIALGSGLAVAGFGILWTIMAIAITSSAPNFGPFAVAKVIFPLFGLGFVAVAIFGAVKGYQMSEKLEHAEREYQQERQDLLDE
ncbi:MAG: hypothetical protein ABJZ55_26120 [Fuerstiella sp.]